jgi:beta-lactamase class A
MAPAGRRVARRGAALAAAVACAVIAVQGQAPDDIRSRIERRLSLFRGTMGVSAVNLATGERIDVNAALRFPTASLIKVAVLVEVAHQIADGRLARDTPVTLQAVTRSATSRWCSTSSTTACATVGDLMALMIAFSDNTAKTCYRQGRHRERQRPHGQLRAEGAAPVPSDLPRRTR